MQIIRIKEEEAGRRLDKFLLKYFDAAPMSFVYKNLRKKNIKLSRKKAEGNEILKPGDEIELYFSDDTLITLSSFAARLLTANDEEEENRMPLKDIGAYCGIVYEDSEIIATDKKAGVLSQKAKPGDISINEILLSRTREEKKHNIDPSERDGFEAFTPSVCNRLDRNTTGLILFAKTYGAAKELSRILKDRSLEKYYLTAVEGRITEKCSVKAWLIKDERENRVRVFDREIEGAARIETVYEPLKSGMLLGKHVTVLKVCLVTGKTHQIRAHLAAEGHPVLGDIKYGNREYAAKLKKAFGISTHLLHSWKMTMPKDLNEPLCALSGKTFTAEPPRYLVELMAETD